MKGISDVLDTFLTRQSQLAGRLRCDQMNLQY